MTRKQDPARNTPARIEAREKATHAVTLRTHGLTWAEVARRAGYPTPDAARVAVNRTLDRVESDAVEHFRAEEDAHLLMLRRAALPAALEGDPQSLAVLLRISESRRKLHGADIPANYSVNISQEENALAEQLANALNEKYAREQKTAEHWKEEKDDYNN